MDLTQSEETIRKVVEAAYLKTMESIEMRFNMNIFPNMETVKFITTRALENVRDMNEEMKSNIRKELELGVIAGEGITKLKNRITKVFGKAENRAEVIARTEVNLAENTAILEGYKQTGLEGKVEWVAKIDGRTSEACKHLDGQKKDIGDKFHYKNWQGFSPPQHPNCRSRLVFIPE